MTEIARGRCSCGEVTYALTDTPLIVHVCHCTWCQRETGTAFAFNGWIEASKVDVLTGEPVDQSLPSASGKGQIVSRCPTCKVALWSQYHGGRHFRFVRLGTLEDPTAFAPGVHIFTSSKHPWVTIPDDVPAFPEFYRPKEVWSHDSQVRYKAALTQD